MNSALNNPAIGGRYYRHQDGSLHSMPEQSDVTMPEPDKSEKPPLDPSQTEQATNKRKRKA